MVGELSGTSGVDVEVVEDCCLDMKAPALIL
jgi:hypothetical protein